MYIDEWSEDSGCMAKDLATVMSDRNEENVSSKAELARPDNDDDEPENSLTIFR